MEQQADYEALRVAHVAGASSRALSIEGATASVAVRGLLTQSPDFFATLFGFGNTTYGEIIAALSEAESDSNVKNIILDIDSPGGQFDGLFDVISAIQSASKPIKAVISNLGASAAYAIASQAQEIVANNRAARIGSVGVVATFEVCDREVTITSSEAPKKRPDVTTEEGQAMVREELDALHELFVESIADGRKTTVKTINAEFGQGATLLAGEALQRGMIDAIAEPKLSVVRASTTTAQRGNQPETIMDLKTLKAQHPDVYSAAVQAGITQERDRVCAHLIMGETSGDTKTAFAAIKDGSEMTATLQATYLAAGMNKQDVDNRQADDTDATAGDKANAGSDGSDAETVAHLVAKKFGVEVSA